MIGKNDINISRFFWGIFGLFLLTVVGFVIYEFIGTFVLGLFIYYASRPAYTRIKTKVKSHTIAALLSLVLLVLPISMIVIYSLMVGVQELEGVIRQYQLENIAVYLTPYIEISSLTSSPGQLLSDGIFDTFGRSLSRATMYLSLLGNGIINVFITMAIAFYLLTGDSKLRKWIESNFVDGMGVFETYFDRVDRSLNQVIFGNIVNVLLTAAIGVFVYTIIAFSAKDVIAIPYPALLGILAGIASLIPIIGMKIIYVPVTLYILIQGLISGDPGVMWVPVVFLVISFVVVDTIPDLIIRPYISGKNLHVGMMMFSYIFGPLIFGWYGIFLGPMLFVLLLHFVELVLPKIISENGVKQNKSVLKKKKK
jgi:predicted PurR-regulated permease PerM